MVAATSSGGLSRRAGRQRRRSSVETMLVSRAVHTRCAHRIEKATGAILRALLIVSRPGP